MKIKNINLSFFILASLIVLSFAFYVGAENNSDLNIFLDTDRDGLSNEEEKAYGTNPDKPDTDDDGYSDKTEINSGYDPTKPAPGDKLVATDPTTDLNQSDSFDPESTVLGESSKNNTTENIAEKINEITMKSAAEGAEISLDELQAIVEETMGQSQTFSEDDMADNVKREDLNIIEQDYGNLSTEKAQAKKKEDFLDYIAAVTYIFSSNSAKPLTSLTDAPSMISNITASITSAISTQNTAGLQDLVVSQQKIVEQLKTVEIPEDLVDMHIKALSFALYSEQLVDLIQPKTNDPLGSIANLSRIEGFMTVFSSFIGEVQDKFAQYGVTYDTVLQNKLGNYGLEAPEDLSELESLVK